LFENVKEGFTFSDFSRYFVKFFRFGYLGLLVAIRFFREIETGKDC